MTEPAGPHQDPPPEPPRMPLQYEQPAPGLARGWQMSLGCLIAVAAVSVAGFVGALGGGIGGTILAPLLVAGLLGYIATSLRRMPHHAGWAAGIWIGIAVSILIEGVCWMALA